MENGTPRPWERQSWESSAAFRAFYEFYLPQDPPRSIDEAYRLSRARKGIIEDSRKRAPGTWRRWSQGNGLSWIDRASAWDKHLVDTANAAIEAQWAVKLMGETEVIGRLSEQGRINIGDFLTQKEVPYRDKHGDAVKDQDGNILTYETWDINWDAVHENGHLIKSITSTRYGPKIELHDGQAALVHVGRHLQLFTDNIDLTSKGKPLQTTEHLNDQQLANALGRLSQIGMALASGDNLHGTAGSPESDDPER